MARINPSIDPKKFAKLYEQHGSIKAVARATGKTWLGVHASYERAVAEGFMEPVKPGRKTAEHLKSVAAGKLNAAEPPVIEGNLRAKKATPLPLRTRGISRFLFTCAQNNTRLHDGWWMNLLAYANAYGAKLHVSQFAYVKKGLGASGDKAVWLKRENYKEVKDWWWDARLVPYLSNEYVEVAPGLIWCGDENILPTAERPLSGYEVTTGRASGIFPHVKFAMESIATVNTEEATKFNYTTGTVTMRNYIERKAGKKAAFHHTYGALLVEVDIDGNWYCRQVNADSEGSFYEFNPKGEGCIFVHDGKITTGHRAEALNSGDNHAEDEEESVFKATWGKKKSLIDTLKPRKQFYNDLCSFTARGHHSIKDPHKQFLYHVRGTENVRNNMDIVVKYLERTHRPWCDGVVVDSNHHDHIGRWLKEVDGRRDPVNARFWFDLGKITYDFMQAHEKEPNHLQEAIRYLKPGLEKQLNIVFLASDGTYVICHEYGGGIECGLHGHKGPNGARGSANNIAKMGRKANIGHSHSARIVDGVYQAGTSSKLKLEYNNGPSSWSQSHILTYPNGKRTIVTVWGGKWRA